jgi:solute carrier family 13 (sodium-dependent dicarboxylate transporter), member 2/3/5
MSVGTPPNAIVYSSGYNSQRDGKSRLPLDFITIVMVTILTSILVPLVFGIG